MSTAQNTTPETITYTYTITKTVEVPRTVTERTDPGIVAEAAHAYWQAVGGEEGRATFGLITLTEFAMAMVEGGAITCLYTDDKGEATARTLMPHALTLTKEGNVVVRAYCTLRRMVKCFRLDRMSGAHVVTMPGETEAAA